MADNKTKSAAAIKAAPWVLEWEDLKIYIVSRWDWENSSPEHQAEIRATYGDGLVIVDWLQALRQDEKGLLVVERSTWAKIPEDIRDKLRVEYGEEDGLRVFPDGFLTLVDTKRYPTSQRGNALLFCKLRGEDYVHTVKPAAGYHWEKLGTDKDGHSGGHWAKDENDTVLKAEVNKLTDNLWQTYLSIHTFESNGDKKAENDDEIKRDARNEQLKKWKKTIRDRYDSFANYELDKILARIKSVKDEEGVPMNSPDQCNGLLPCLNGVYELATGNFRSTRKEDYVSYFCPTIYDPEAKDRETRQALDLFFDVEKDVDRAEKIEGYFWELVGIGLYPNLRKDTKAVVQMIGPSTNNGKSTLMRALMSCLGDVDNNGLAQSLRPEAFSKVSNANSTTLTPDLATIGEARLVFVSEPDEKLRINWALIKDLTGGGYMKINDKHEKVRKTDSRFTMYWDTNFYLRADDPTIFARGTMKLIPFEHVFQKKDRDPEIDQKLSTPSARSYILQLMLAGLRRYLSKGFSVPAICKKMVEDYENGSDKIGEFLTQNYVKTGKPSDKIPLKKEVYTRYTEWCAENGYKGVESFGEFARKLKNRPGVVIGTRNNAQTLDGWATPENLTKTDPFSGLAPLDWYIKTHTAENNPAEGGGEKQILAGMEQPLQESPPLTLEELWRDHLRQISKAGPAVATLDLFGLFAELMRRGWAMDTNTADIGKTEILGRHILTAGEMGKQRTEEAQKLHKKIRGGIKEKLDGMESEEARKSITYLIKTEALAGLLAEMAEGQATALKEALLTGGGLDRAISHQIDIALRFKY